MEARNHERCASPSSARMKPQMRLLASLLVAVASGSAVPSWAPKDGANAVLKRLQTPPALAAVYAADYFYINVFGVSVVASPGVSEAGHVHAAAVLAQFLDNDADGVCDEQAVCDAMVKARATLTMHKDEDEESSNGFTGSVVGSINLASSGSADAMQNLFDVETHPDSCALLPNRVCTAASDTYEAKPVPCGRACKDAPQFDASLEEVLHLVTHVGVVAVHPADFGEQKDSVSGAMYWALNGNCGWGYDGTYKEADQCKGTYAYDDESCDESCVCSEGVYWGLTTVLGAQNYSVGRTEQIQREWRTPTKASLAAANPALVALLTNTKQFPWLPTTLPDGRYMGTTAVDAVKPLEFAQGNAYFIVFGLVLCCGGCCAGCFKRKRGKQPSGGIEMGDGGGDLAP